MEFIKNMILENDKIREYLIQKDELVKTGREVSQEIEAIEKEVAKLEEQEKEITGKVEPADLIEAGKKIRDEINAGVAKLEEIGKQIHKAKWDAIPEDIKKRHYQLMKDKESKERERNKIALKVQKIKDRVIPLVQKEIKPHLAEYDDIESVKVFGKKLSVTTFNHLAEWKKTFAEKSRK